MDQKIKEILIIRPLQNMVFALSTQNINITTYDFGKNPCLFTPENIKSGLMSIPREFRNRTILDGFRDIFTISQLITTLNPDIIHVNALQDLLTIFIARQITPIKGTQPAIIGMSHNPLSWVNPKRAWLNAKLIKYFSDGFVSLTTANKDLIIRLGVAVNRITVIPNPYDPTQVETSQYINRENPNKKLKIIYVANICKRKAQDILINAASYVLNKYPDVKFELIGKVIPGEEDFTEKLKYLIEKFDLEQSILMTGKVPYDDVITSVKNCDIFVFPTLAEMMPRAVIEAMVIGKPVIASAVDGIIDLIQHRINGILVQPGNVRELASAICELIENPGLANTLGLEGQKFVMVFCSPEMVGRQFRIFYEKILEGL